MSNEIVDLEQLRVEAAAFYALRNLIADDGFASTFQSMGQYRTELLKVSKPAT
jgi:hypothetical protein